MSQEGRAAWAAFAARYGEQGMSFRPRATILAPVVFQFEVFGSAALRHDVMAEGDGLQAGPAGRSKAGMALCCGNEPYLLYMYGRVTAAWCATSGRLDVAGGPSSPQRFEEWFEGL